MRNHIRINEAIEENRKRGRYIKRRWLAMLLYPNSTYHSGSANLSNLSSGKSLTIRLDVIKPLCEVLNCTSDYLFGLTDEFETSKDDNQV